MFGRRWLLGFGLALAAVSGATNPASAGVLDASWTAPTTNTDGSALTDLASYKVYYSTSGTPCPGSTSLTVATSTSTPPSNQTVNVRLTGLTTGSTYNVSVAAVDSGGNQSACSAVASAVAQVDIAVTPNGTNFGNVNIGSFATQTFTVQSTRGGTITGTASVPAPFTIVSGSPFTLAGTGATATVTVRFTPTTTVAASTNINFTADGDTISRLVTGTGVSTGSSLTVTKAGTGSGTVTSSSGGINCGATCSASYTNGTAVTLTASAATGSTFAGWSGGGCAGTGTCTVTVSAATSVTATFTRPSFALSVIKSGNGSGTVTSAPTGINCGATCSASFTSAVTLTAAPAAGSTFTGWTGGGCTGTGICTVTLNAATSVTATFALQSFALTVTKSGAGSGTVTSAPTGINCGATCSASFTSGTAVSLTAAPAAGSTFTGWSGSCAGIGACNVTMSAAGAVTATFTISPVSFTDNPLVARTTVMKAVHIIELRTAIGAARTRNGLTAFAFTDPTLAAGATVKAVHILELRTALNQVYTRLARALPTYTDPTLVAGQTTAKAAHVQELRNAVSALP
jgi:Divergent InlB B-repeat domain/Fibronectin type III domain